MHFTTLKLIGFKSFIEPSELAIRPGTTGIVGPNGCGKSNIVEALRWVMGETAPRHMRSGGMEDVIFNGTEARSSRNIAEVSLVLDNSDRTAPSAFNQENTIEIVRKIERGAGSAYSVNGQEVRAKDVQYLFADFATGAHSSALVGQGSINDIINAKPSQRRGILEEAAGISGLHARRHEAELRLRGAETNLERLDDVVGGLETQLNGLKRQSRQANRYQRISENLKKSEALLLYTKWINANEEVKIRQTQIESEASKVSELTSLVAKANKNYIEASEALPDLRKNEGSSGAILHRLAVERDRLKEEEEQIEKQTIESKAILSQVEKDITRESALGNDAESTLYAITQERQLLVKTNDECVESEENSQNAYNESSVQLLRMEEDLSNLTKQVMSDEVDQNNLDRTLEHLLERKQIVLSEKDSVIDKLRNIETKARAQQAVTDQKKIVEKVRIESILRRDRHSAAEAEREKALKNESYARDELQTKESLVSKLEAEMQALLQILGEDDTPYASIVDQLHVMPGYEGALGAALGDDLEASDNPEANIYWTEIGRLKKEQNLPSGIIPLSKFVQGPEVLSIRLSQVGIVSENGDTIRQELLPGQRLVSKDGAMWRWDGLTVKKGTSTTAAKRLKQRNRLREIKHTASDANKDNEQAKQHFENARQFRSSVEQKTLLERNKSEEALQALDLARDRLESLIQEAIAENAQLTALRQSVARYNVELTDLERELDTTRASIAESLPQEKRKMNLLEQRQAMAALRSKHEELARSHDRLVRDAIERKNLIEKLDEEVANWAERLDGAKIRLAELTNRRDSAETKIKSLESLPAQLSSRYTDLLSKIEQAEAARNKAATQLNEAETDLAEKEKTLRNTERALASAREERVRIEGLVEQASQSEQTIVAQIEERLSATPTAALTLSEHNTNEKLPPPEETEARIGRLTRERDNIGPVNLRAEVESSELNEEIETLMSERSDLEAAIQRLRQGISTLNKDGRQRVIAAFKVIDGHFQSLFTRLYGGGHAYLELVESDDPLEAGLEIMASPPGKRLQSLNLLSGGEKALTALALLFAVFLTHPAPICVLDEVDAPLDDNNVGRFCDLVRELAAKSGTRFIVVTHHRTTMAQMDRLFGVTMVERGVSQLVSVDLAEAEKWRETV